MESPGAEVPLNPGLPAAPASIPPPDYKDRSTGLIVFGILEVLGGGMCALALPLMLVSMVFARKTGGALPLRSLVVPIVTYAVMAIVLVVLGIGAIMAKRWAWALNLILSWLWLIVGVLGTAALVYLLPSSFLQSMHTAAEQTPSAGNVSTGVIAAILTFLIVLLAVFFVFLPLAFLLFYRSRNVEQTCKHRDPVERWTDRRPLPITAMAMLAAAGALYTIFMSVATPMFPLFGRYLTGWTAGVVLLLFAAINVYVAVSFLRLKVSGWWVSVATVTFTMVSSALTMRGSSLAEAYSHLGWSHDQVAAIQAAPWLRSGAFAWWTIGLAAVHLGFLLWLKQYFRPAVTVDQTALNPAASNPEQPGS